MRKRARNEGVEVGKRKVRLNGMDREDMQTKERERGQKEKEEKDGLSIVMRL